MRLGIDFGTTRTVVASAQGGRYPVATFESTHGYSDYIPGIAALHDQAVRFGWPAVEILEQRPTAAIRSVKRRLSGLAPEEPVEIGPRALSALDLATGYLKELRRALLDDSNLDLDGDEPLEAMVAVPANASTRQRYLTLEAFARAGFHVLGLVSEPTAAAIEFARHNLGAIGRRSPKRYVVVYDLGGGTFDVSAVSLAGRRFELISSEGIVELGGNDFDELILRMALEAAQLEPSELSPPERVRMLEACRQAKESLNPSSRRLLVELEHEDKSRGPGGRQALTRHEMVLDASAVHEAAQPLVDRTLSLVNRIFATLAHQGIDPSNPRELGALYAVGGSTAFVPVMRSLRQHFKRKLCAAPQPQASTAIGLAVAADPDSGILVREAVTRHFGVWREAEAGREKVFDPIFSKDSRSADGALVATRSYRPAHSVGHLRYLECSELAENGRPTGDLTPWGEIFFAYDPAFEKVSDHSELPLERRSDLDREEITETYRYLAEGTVEVQIENRARGLSRSYTLGSPQ
jgi:molecular chaperone DnaK (HSP70)